MTCYTGTESVNDWSYWDREGCFLWNHFPRIVAGVNFLLGINQILWQSDIRVIMGWMWSDSLLLFLFHTVVVLLSVWGANWCHQLDLYLLCDCAGVKEGQPLMEGKLKEKQVRWKFIKRWKTRYFTLAGNQLLFRRAKAVRSRWGHTQKTTLDTHSDTLTGGGASRGTDGKNWVTSFGTEHLRLWVIFLL